jgi:hypothetical protein
MGATVEGCGLETGSVFETFLETVCDYLDEIYCSPGDISRLRWHGAPVEVLFVDIAKSWDLNLWVLRQWFTALIPGQSIVIQQDYVWFDAWWIAVTMEYFRDCFERLGFVFGASAVYRCIGRVTPERIDAFSRLTFDDMRAFMQQAIYSAPESVAQVLRCGMARLLMERDRSEAARVLAEVKLDVSSSDPTEDFSINVKSNYDVMAGWLR